MSIASATTPATPAKAEATNAIELTPAEMDTLSAGSSYYYYYYNPRYSSNARAASSALSFGRYTTASTATSTFTAYGVADSNSSAYSYSSN
jgi:hypothetical protein